MAEKVVGSSEKEKQLESFRENLGFFHKHIIVGKGEFLKDNPEEWTETYDMELFFGSQIWPEAEDEVKDKLGVDLDQRPNIEVVDNESRTRMFGWRTDNPDWILLRWNRDDGVQLLTYEEVMLEDFIGSLGLQIKTD